MDLKNKNYWITADKRKIPISRLGESHLKNIIKKLVKNGRKIPRQIEEEYIKRGYTPGLQKLIKAPSKLSILIERIDALEKEVAYLKKMQDL